MPERKFCQSCAMPMDDASLYGHDADGRVSEDYCKYCYEKGEFLHKVTMEEFVEMCAQFGEQAGMTNEEMHKHCATIFPTLKRWRA